MTTALDVAEEILANRGAMTTMKLQKLVYYCQAWHLAWEGEPLFDEPIKAWASGPVIPALHQLHQGRFRIWPGQLRLTAEARAARIKVYFRPQNGREWTWEIPNLAFGGMITGRADTPAQAADAARQALADHWQVCMNFLAQQSETPYQPEGTPA